MSLDYTFNSPPNLGPSVPLNQQSLSPILLHLRIVVTGRPSPRLEVVEGRGRASPGPPPKGGVGRPPPDPPQGGVGRLETAGRRVRPQPPRKDGTSY